MIHKKLYLDKNTLFQIYMMIMVACKAFGINQEQNVYFIVFSIAMIFFIISIFLHKWNKKILLLFMILLFVMAISYFTGNNITPIIFFMSIMGSINVDKKHTLDLLCKEWILLFCINITLCLTGIKSMQMAYQYTETGIDGVAYGLGYGQKNQLAVACAIVVCAFIYLRYDTMKLYELIVVDIIIFIILGYARSSTGYIILLFINFMYFLFKARFMGRFIQKIVLYMTPFVVILSVLLSLLYPYSSIIKLLDRLFSTRIHLGYYALQEAPISMFGKYVEVTLDNLYICTYVKNGFIAYIIVLVVFWGTMKYLYSMNMKKEMIVWGSMILVGFCEGAVMNPYINIFSIFVGWALETKFGIDSLNYNTENKQQIDYTVLSEVGSKEKL